MAETCVAVSRMLAAAGALTTVFEVFKRSHERSTFKASSIPKALEDVRRIHGLLVLRTNKSLGRYGFRIPDNENKRMEVIPPPASL